MTGPSHHALVDHLFRHQYGRMVASLTRIFGSDRLDLVEDVVQEALLQALRVWPFQGIPERPEAWLIGVARNRALDVARHRQMAARKLDELKRWAQEPAEGGAVEPERELKDDQLRMIFTCCHPALSADSRVALTLKLLCGLDVPEIARALLSNDVAVYQRLTRAKAQLQREGLPFEVPGEAELSSRLDSVLEVLYLLFNEGYSAHAGENLVRRDLIAEAMRLCGLILDVPAIAQPKAHALMALMHLQGSRVRARQDAVGDALTLARQDRSLWDRTWVMRGLWHFERSIGGDELTAWHEEAAIAAVHATAASYAATDWPRILGHYDRLRTLASSPIVELNRAIAVAKVHGVAAGLRELGTLEGRRELASYHLLPATRAQLLWVAGDFAAAEREFERAAAMDCSAPEQAFLRRRADACGRKECCADW